MIHLAYDITKKTYLHDNMVKLNIMYYCFILLEVKVTVTY